MPRTTAFPFGVGAVVGVTLQRDAVEVEPRSSLAPLLTRPQKFCGPSDSGHPDDLPGQPPEPHLFWTWNARFTSSAFTAWAPRNLGRPDRSVTPICRALVHLSGVRRYVLDAALNGKFHHSFQASSASLSKRVSREWLKRVLAPWVRHRTGASTVH